MPAAVPSCSSVPIGVQLPFRIFKVQADGALHFVVAVQTFDDAKGRVRELGAIWRGKYVIENQKGERIFINTTDESKK